MPTGLALPLGLRRTAAPATRRKAIVLATAFAALAVSLGGVESRDFREKAHPSLIRQADDARLPALDVIVGETRPASGDAEELIDQLGGSVTHELPIVGGFSARLPTRSLRGLLSSPAVAHVWGDGRVRMSILDLDLLDGMDSVAANKVWRQSIRLPSSYTGAGVGVAVLDTGLTRVADLGNRVSVRVDFTSDHDGYDRFGHGTHMAGLIAGDGALSGGTWAGAARKASLISVKVAGTDGSTDVSVVIAAMQWIVTHRAAYNIRILNLSFGTDAIQTYLLDPLDYAVEQVWRSGITVIVAAGNRGSLPGTINKPGDDPFVITVGAADVRGTASTSDDVVAGFSSRGPTHDLVAKPDLVAPGIGLVSLRAPGSTLDTEHPTARVGDYYFKGSGTSQAAAIVSGVAALMIQANPSITPDVLKAALVGTAKKMGGLLNLIGTEAGAGLVDATAAVNASVANTYASKPANRALLSLRSTGAGLIQLSRDSSALVYSDLDADGPLDLVVGEVDALGNAWLGSTWSDAWSNNRWAPYVFEAIGWDGKTWGGKTWGGTSWKGKTWGGKTWS
ncbi:MAG TPA: S8 family peptidase [Actinomycetota bacterium]|jgi:serine protease AprX|nr:S8 family peptidase [Actinomycetota bacterium]